MKALVLFSGGIDSTTALAMAIDKFGNDNVTALSLSYGQKHSREIASADKIASYYNVRHIKADMAEMFKFSDCSLLAHSDKEIPTKSYDEQIKENEGEPVSTYVPFRNGLFLSAAASIGLSLECDVIYYGIHRDDAAGNAYPDCSEVFNKAMAEAIYEGSGKKIRIEAPFVGKNKADIIAQGIKLGVPYEYTWSCYSGGDKPCGVCATCIDRKRAFEENGMNDPAMD
ncbi:MAG: 7-cyano-7-deazaguanine synthase QueC [Firmicutes bacterium]|nr:7-cyano-7-deazaguanine synthase QueC [Bacillota bacterium]